MDCPLNFSAEQHESCNFNSDGSCRFVLMTVVILLDWR